MEYEPDMDTTNYFYSEQQEETQQYIRTHKFTLDNREYVIENELNDIEYANDYIRIKQSGIAGSKEFFIPYSSITYANLVSINNFSRFCNKYVYAYNKIQYELNKGE